jgi:hypothetical protein
MANSVTISLPTTFPDHSSSVIGQLTAAQIVAKYPSFTAKTATKSFSFPFNGHIVSFLKGAPVACAPDLLAALTAAGAPVVCDG